eukprot:2247264-Rhodomonas_salina.2
MRAFGVRAASACRKRCAIDDSVAKDRWQLSKSSLHAREQRQLSRYASTCAKRYATCTEPLNREP